MLGLRYLSSSPPNKFVFILANNPQEKHKKQKSRDSEEQIENTPQTLSTTSTHDLPPTAASVPTQSTAHTESSRSKRSSFASRFRRSSSIDVGSTVSDSSHPSLHPEVGVPPDNLIATVTGSNPQPTAVLPTQRTSIEPVNPLPLQLERPIAQSTPQQSPLVTRERQQDSEFARSAPVQVAANVSEPTRTSRTGHSPNRFSIATSLTSQLSVVSQTPSLHKSPVQSYTMMSPKLSSPNGYGNLNSSNGVLSPPMSPSGALRSKGRIGSFTSSRATSGNFGMKSFSKRGATGGGYKIGFVQESAISLKKRSMAELGAGVHQNISNVSYVNFLEWIRAERLTTLPHKGSRWDKVLIRALYFAEQLHNFDQAIQGFALDSQAAAAVGYGHARILLELGHENSAALDKAFAVFYKFSLSFSSVLRRSELLAATSEIREQLCFLYTDLISLVVDVSVRFYKTANGMTSGSASLDIFELFGETIEGFRSRQDSVVELIWESQIDPDEFEDGEALDVKVLSRWLSSQDRVLATLNRDHSFFVDQQVEMTCIWFQKHLNRFLQSDKSFLLVTGQPGAGKTTLAGSIVERLQRPVNRKQVDTLFCSLSPDVPTTATSLAVVKSLLSQLLNQRVGNMSMYNALFRAYHHCRASDDLKAYEEHLWQALGDALKHPLEGGNDLVMVVDGLDEIESSQSASIQAAGGISSAKLLEKLVNVTNQGHKVRLITLSSNAKMPAHAHGMLHEVTRDDIRDDLHAVALRALINNHHFHSKPGNEQEAMLDRLIQTANGSFLWTILACELLNTQKSADSVTSALKDLETNKHPVQSLVHKLFTSFEPSNNAKTLLLWVLAAERPLTTEEIHILFTVDTKSGTLTDKGVNVHDVLKTLKPFLSMSEHIVRFRHPIVHSALHELAHKNQIPIPLKDSETDLLLRVLSYAKFTLRDKGEPTIDNDDPTIADRLFRQHRFLEYTVRYWILHLQQSPLMPKNPAEFKPTPELQKVLPDTTTLSILEQIVWGTQLPLPQSIDLHYLAGNVRKTVFTENHPTVLQTYLSIATSYLLLSDTKNASSYFFTCTKICHTVLSDIHPLTLECANHFLRISDTLITTTRTEIMTRREQTLTLLITAYERQYGSTSELVIQTRKQLVELYASLKEEDKALEIFRLIQEATIQHYGRNSHQAQDIEGHLNVVLGKGRGDRRIDSYKESFFDDHDDENQVEVFDFGSIVAYLRKAESYVSRKEFALAERTYVELWQRVSSQSRSTQSIEWHEKNIEIATTYSQYLKTQKRTTESSAVLTVVWEQYQHHQLSYSESIVARLTSVAKEMKTLGSYTMALSIFKHASSFYKNVRQEESSMSREINKEVSETSTELVRQSLAASSSSSETTTTVSESVYKDVFFSVIQSSKTVDSSTIALAKKLSAKYMEERNFTQAISVIQATLQRTWSSFLSSSIHNVTLTSTFTQESIELVERLAECYLQLKQMERVEDTYSRFFRAALVTKEVDKAIFEKARNLLIEFYDKHGYQDNAISVYQDILVTYRTRFGPTHELTIQTLYILARRCQQHPRNHPYWIEYYLQIISSLNKDSDVCHKDALDAIIVVTTTYWQDRRYAEAVTIYRTLWNTFVRQTKQHKVFSEEKFVQTLYERYYQCLEETKASFEFLYQVAKEYRETAIATFGASSSIAVEATLALAQVSQRSEEHLSQAISLYEEASRSSKTTTTTTRSSEMKQALSSLYVRQMKSQSSSSYKAEHVERALSMTQEQLTESTSKYGYSHESSLSHVRELATLYQRQQKSDLAVKTLTTASSQVILKEQSSQKQIESAGSIAASFHACQQSSAAHSLVQELHRQICAKDTRYASKWSFDLTKTSRASLAFLASLQYNLRKDLNITFAEIMASLTMEYIYFEQFRNTLQNNESLTNILLAAAPLRFFLRQNGQDEMITVVEDQAVSLFEKRDAQDLQTLSKETPRIFIVGILDHLGSGRNKDFNRSVINASNDSVAKLTKAKKFPEAYDIANLGFLYASKHDGYNGPRSIGLGFKLASLLVGRDSEKATDAALRKKMLDLSNKIVRKILDICKSLKINFAQIQLFELSHLSVLLGEQHDYETLEWLLTTLWNTRDAQRSWPPEVLLNLGRRLICARYLAGSPIKAIRLAEDIAYNMRRAHGPRAPVTIETYELLAQLYTSMGQTYQSKASSEKTGPLAQEYFKKALGVHEDILRLMVHEHGSGDDSDDELDTTAYLLAKEGVDVKKQEDQATKAIDEHNIDKSAIALRHLQLLKLAYQRLGGWPKSYDEYERLNAQVFRTFINDPNWKGVQGTERWSAKDFGNGKAESQDGGFNGLEDWALGSDKVILRAQNGPQQIGSSGAPVAHVHTERAVAYA